MALLARGEDRPTPRAVYNRRVYLCAATAAFASCAIGYDSAFIGTAIALPSFGREFGLGRRPASELALLRQDIVSAYQAGAFAGSLAAYFASHGLGRRRSLLAFAAVFLAGAAAMLAAGGARGAGPVVAGRALAGFAVGGCSCIAPVYVSELSPPAIRGRLVGLYELGWQLGGLVGFWISYAVDRTMAPSRRQWQVPFAVQLIPGGLLFVGALLIPESPRWLLAAGRRRRATEVLCWVRGLAADDVYVVREIGQIDDDLELHRAEVGPGVWRPFLLLKKPSIRRRFLLGALLFLFQNGSGINAINYYSPTVFRSIGLRDTAFLTTGIFGVIKAVLTVVWLLVLVDQVGRRKLLMIGSAGASLCMWFLGACIKISDPSPASRESSLSPAGIAAIFFFYLWTAFYSPTWNGTPWLINTEMYGQSTRSLGQANAAANNWFWNFLVARFTEQMFNAWGYGVYFFFAALLAISFFFVFFFIPETSSLPLESADRLFEMKPTWRANGMLMEQLRREEVEFRQAVGETKLEPRRSPAGDHDPSVATGRSKPGPE